MSQDKPPALARRIAHLDMDAFFASVSLLRYPQLKGLPVVIGGARRAQDDILKRIRTVDPDWDDERPRKFPIRYFPTLSGYVGRGVITTATYEARKFGIGSAMGLMKAAKLCPQAILLPVDFEQYQKYSKQFKEIISEIAPLMENRGIDEVYVDLTEVPGVWRSGGKVLARVIQQTIYSNTGLTCSIGVAPNKLLAKMAGEINKPNGITVINDGDIQTFLWPLPCSKVPGIGPKTQAKLMEFGVVTVGDLAEQDLLSLQMNFGKNSGYWLHQVARGRDDSPVVVNAEPVSISRETTFSSNLQVKRDRTLLGEILTNLSQQVADDLTRKGYLGKTIGVKIRYPDFKIVTRDLTLPKPTANAQEIRLAAGHCLKRIDLSGPFRLLGLRVGNLLRIDLANQADGVLRSLHASDVASNAQIDLNLE